MKHIKKLLMIWLLLPLLVNAQQANDSRVLLQGFYWNAQENTSGWYNIVGSLAPDISAAGIDMIWLPPPSDAGAPQGYLPRQLNNLSNAYGTQQEHIAMLQALNANGIEPIADIVINHRVGSATWVDFTNPSWGTASITANDEVWSQSAYSGVYPRGNNDSGSGYEAARDIDHSQQFVRESIKNWMNMLRSVGYKGWRYDFVHGFWAGYIAEYNAATNAQFSVGEDWKSKQEIQDWVDASGSTAFDFTTYYLLKDAIKNGNYGGLNAGGQAGGGIGWDPAKMVTFIENHDTPRYDPGNNILNSGNVGQAYAYLLTHPGVPTIYWPHYFDWGVKTEIDAILAIRKANGINSTSTVDIKSAGYNLYAAVIDGKVAMKIGGGNWSPQTAGLSGTWILETYGNNYAVWVKQTVPNPNPGSNLVIHFYNSSNWANPTMYFWAHNGTATIPSWPGVSLQNDGNGWFSYTIAGASQSNIIFSNNGASQTADLSRNGEGWYKNGTWFNENPDSPIPNPTGLTLHFFNSANWANPKMYFWAHNGTATIPSWPGVSLQNDGNGWFSYTIAGASQSNIIFSNNGVSQTADLSRNGEGWYKNGTWFNENPDNQPAPTGLTIHYFNSSNWANPKMYFWAHNGTATIPSWPGVSMQNNGNGWFSYTIAGATQSNIIFSNNGASQTADLTRSGEGWYKNGAWFGSQPSISHPDLKDNLVLEPNEEIPTEFGVSSVFPNPFNPTTTFRINMSESGSVSVAIYSVMGQLVAAPVQNKDFSAGTHDLRFDASHLASGTYIYVIRFIDGSKSVSGTIQLIK